MCFCCLDLPIKRPLRTRWGQELGTIQINSCLIHSSCRLSSRTFMPDPNWIACLVHLVCRGDPELQPLPRWWFPSLVCQVLWSLDPAQLWFVLLFRLYMLKLSVFRIKLQISFIRNYFSSEFLKALVSFNISCCCGWSLLLFLIRHDPALLLRLAQSLLCSPS